MPLQNSFSTKLETEKAYLVGVELYSRPGILSVNDSLEELALLSNTAGLEVVGITSQKLDRPHAATLIGSGKAQEIKLLAEDNLADVIIFDEELSPRHLRELQSIMGFKMRVIDRSNLILDIFAQHANSSEGKLQVELAQYEYLYPRLTGAWTHLERQAGGGGGRSGGVGGVGLRGPGETQLEVDRRKVRKRIDQLKIQLEKVREHRKRQRVNRSRTQIPVVSLVGYTNAGKSTLINALAQADVYIADQLFATLDPTTRRIELPGGNVALITDTVGFILKLPAQLIAAFRSTLEEITEADLLLHVVDINHPAANAHWRSVNETLLELGAGTIPSLTILNKIDKVQNVQQIHTDFPEFQDALRISAKLGTGIEILIDRINHELFQRTQSIKVILPYKEGRLISIFHEYGQIQSIENRISDVFIQGTIPARFLADFEPFLVLKQKTPKAGVSAD